MTQDGWEHPEASVLTVALKTIDRDSGRTVHIAAVFNRSRAEQAVTLPDRDWRMIDDDMPWSGKAPARSVTFVHVMRGPATKSIGWGVVYRNDASADPVYWLGFSQTPVTVTVEDMGPASYAVGALDTLGGTPYDATQATTNDTGVQAYTSTYTASAVRSWRGSTEVTDALHHGTYGGITRASAAVFPAQLATDLTGATVTKVEVYLRNLSAWSSSMTVTLGTLGSSALPTSRPTASNNPHQVTWAEGAGTWVTMPATWLTTALRGLTLGAGAGTGTSEYGKFSYALADVKLRVSYTK